MNTQDIFRHVDHTLLRPTVTWPEIELLCREAILYRTATVCIPPSYVSRAISTFGEELPVCTVIGFPLGHHTLDVKCVEAGQALRDGAVELDVVVNLADVKNGEFNKVTSEIKALRRVAGDRVLKIIVETCYLTLEEKETLCGCVVEGGADFIKTSTGFGPKGADLLDVRLMLERVGPHVRVKASGGIRTRDDFTAYLEAGCSRIGTSSAVQALVTQGR